jgi:hypothetical protein
VQKFSFSWRELNRSHPTRSQSLQQLSYHSSEAHRFNIYIIFAKRSARLQVLLRKKDERFMRIEENKQQITVAARSRA